MDSIFTTFFFFLFSIWRRSIFCERRDQSMENLQNPTYFSPISKLSKDIFLKRFFWNFTFSPFQQNYFWDPPHYKCHSSREREHEFDNVTSFFFYQENLASWNASHVSKIWKFYQEQLVLTRALASYIRSF